MLQPGEGVKGVCVWVMRARGFGLVEVGGNNKTTAEINRGIMTPTAYDTCSSLAPAKKSNLKFRKI